MEQVEVANKAGVKYRVRYNQTRQGPDVVSVVQVAPQPIQIAPRITQSAVSASRTSCFAKSKFCCLVAVHGGALAALAIWVYLHLNKMI